MHMHVVFRFLNVWMTKRTLSIDLNYSSFTAIVLTILFSKMKGRPRRHFAISNSKIAFDIWNTINSNQIQWQKCNRLSKRGGLFSLTENDTCDTFKSKDDSLIKLLFVKENCKWWKIHKNIHNYLSMDAG